LFSPFSFRGNAKLLIKSSSRWEVTLKRIGVRGVATLSPKAVGSPRKEARKQKKLLLFRDESTTTIAASASKEIPLSLATSSAVFLCLKKTCAFYSKRQFGCNIMATLNLLFPRAARRQIRSTMRCNIYTLA